VHAPQTCDAVAEARELMAVDVHLVSPNSKPSMGPVQNSVLGVALLASETRLTRAQLSDLVEAMLPRGCTTLPRIPPPAAMARRGGRWVGLWTGRQVLSLIVPASQTRRGDAFENELVVDRGELIAGELGKSVFGTGRGCLLHTIMLDETPARARSVIDALGRVACAYLCIRGFTMGMADCLGAIPLPPAPSLAGLDEHDAQLKLVTYRSQIAANVDAAGALLEGNALITMVRCGSKGNPVNAAQTMCCVGCAPPRRER